MSKEHTASEASLEAMRENDAHSTGTDDAVPGGAHAHSPAAHEGGPKAHTKPAEDERTLISAEEQQSLRLDRGGSNNRGVGAGLRGDSGTRGQ